MSNKLPSLNIVKNQKQIYKCIWNDWFVYDISLPTQ